MRSILPLIFAIIITALLTFSARWLLRSTNNKVWKISFLDKIAVYLPYTTFMAFGLTLLGTYLKLNTLVPFALTPLVLLIIFSLILIFTLPFSLGVNLFGAIIEKINGLKKQTKTDPDRRFFLKAAAASLPLLITTTTGSGFAGGFQKVNIPQIKFTYKNLPDSLDGLRILHLSDLHLGYYFQLNDLEKLLMRLDMHDFDLVLLTGDVADDLSELPDALKMIDQLKTPHPKFISLGNHEYFRGLDEVVRHIESSPIQLLRSASHTLQVNNSALYIGGADDPVRMHADISDFMEKTVSQAMAEAPGDAFKILLSHRPRALDIANNHQIDLLLSGHTHGGQIGFNKRSVFEDMLKERYLWGKYKKGKTQLYTSAGVGHWLPFRLGCPPEAPIIVLNRYPQDDDQVL